MTDHDDDLPVRDAVELYLDAREEEVTQTTIQAHRYRLNHLIRWSEENDYSLRDIGPLQLTQYRTWRKDDGGLNRTTVHTQMVTLRVFLTWCADKQLVPERLPDAVDVPSISVGDNVRDETLDASQAGAILEYHSIYHYASFDHLMLHLLAQSAMRIGSVRGLDLDDYDREERRLTVRHRPETETTLKNGERGERTITLTDKTCTLIDDYVDGPRHDVVDEHDRRPLLSTKEGRPNTSWLRRVCYRITQPCYIGEACPHGEDPETCAAEGYNGNGTPPSKCPSTHPPHDVRRGTITAWRSMKSIPDEAIQERANVSKKILDEHYDKRSEEQRAEQRREYFE